MPNPGDVQSFDRYAYVNNNPMKYTDPTGHFAEDQISLLCGGCKTWDDLQRVFGAEAMSLLKSQDVTFGSLLLAGAETEASAKYAFVLRGEYDGHEDRFRVGLWDMNNNREVSLADALAHTHVTAWSTDTTQREGGYTYAGWDKGFDNEVSAENWASPSERGRIDLEGIHSTADFTRYRTYYDINGWLPISLVATGAGAAFDTVGAIFSSSVDLADTAAELVTSRPWYDGVYPMVYTGNNWTGQGPWFYLVRTAPSR